MHEYVDFLRGTDIDKAECIDMLAPYGTAMDG